MNYVVNLILIFCFGLEIEFFFGFCKKGFFYFSWKFFVKDFSKCLVKVGILNYVNDFNDKFVYNYCEWFII